MADDDSKVKEWFSRFNVKFKNYYVVVGRFVPENNFEAIIREFMKSKTKKDLVIVTDYQNNVFYDGLLKSTGFNKDRRIKFVGTVYDQPLLKKIRENAFAYIHGHSVGGTNPSLLEALGLTDVNLLFDVIFNREVAEDGAKYWSLDDGDLAALIDKTDNMSENEIETIGNKAKKRIDNFYNWEYITEKYQKLFRK